MSEPSALHKRRPIIMLGGWLTFVALFLPASVNPHNGNVNLGYAELPPAQLAFLIPAVIAFLYGARTLRTRRAAAAVLLVLAWLLADVLVMVSTRLLSGAKVLLGSGVLVVGIVISVRLAGRASARVLAIGCLALGLLLVWFHAEMTRHALWGARVALAGSVVMTWGVIGELVDVQRERTARRRERELPEARARGRWWRT